jgi:diguanylate cyclase (GGDEF)-like protein
MKMQKLTRTIVFIGMAALALAIAVTQGLFSADYLPHRFCYLAKPGLIWTNVSMDSVIATSYALIFASLVWMTARLRHLQKVSRYLWIALAFAVFILACGATHLMDVVTIWWPVYPLSAAVKVVCAAASVATAVLFAREEPRLAAAVIRFLEMEASLREANAELLELSAVDALTGLTNRRGFDSIFSSEWIRAKRSHTPLAVLMMDIDHFKMRNDRYGHLAGDECLRRVAEVLASRRTRAEDVVARYGGEEFALILPGAGLAGAHRIANEIRCAVAALAIPNEDAPTGPTVTVSIGVASETPSSAGEPRDLLAAADAALFRAKRLGRNRTELSDHANVPASLKTPRVDAAAT